MVLRLDFTGEPDLVLRHHASHRATTSSRTPGKINSGVVYARAFEHKQLFICKCGQTQKPCELCGKHICRAPGHLAHACGGDW